MSISEARRQVELLYKLDANSFKSENILASMIPHAVEALVEAIAENRPYDGTLNNIRIPLVVVRQMLVEMNKLDMEDVGLEDFLITLKARIAHYHDLDNNP